MDYIEQFSGYQVNDTLSGLEIVGLRDTLFIEALYNKT